MSASSTSHELLSRFMVEKVFNEGQLDLLPFLLAPGSVNHEMDIFGLSAEHGTELVREYVELFRFAFPDLRMTVIDQISNGDRVVTRWLMEGTQDKRLLGIEASHRHVQLEGIRIDRIADGRIAETWSQWDAIGLLRQIGALPAIERRPTTEPRPAHATLSAAA